MKSSDSPTQKLPTPGSLRAANEILEMRGVNRKLRELVKDKYAVIIDRETVAPEMLEALEKINGDQNVSNCTCATCVRIKVISEAAIKKARGEK